MGKIYIGTSGFSYRHWENGVFYPPKFPQAKKLEYYCQHFRTVELNSTFYHLPKKEVFLSWGERVPGFFVFAVKVSRFITHRKRLKGCREPWERFLERSLLLGEKLGPFLFQLPGSFKKDAQRLEDFVGLISKISPQGLRFAFEFRDESWISGEIYQILKGNNCAWVIADSPRWPKREVITADFIYIRMHGSQSLFSSRYSKKELRSWAKKIKRWAKDLDVYCYFNNDAYGFAVENAKELLDFLRE